MKRELTEDQFQQLKQLRSWWERESYEFKSSQDLKIYEIFRLTGEILKSEKE